MTENENFTPIETVARAMQDWCENGTIHLSTHVPKSWEEDDPDWWIGLAEVAFNSYCAEQEKSYG